MSAYVLVPAVDDPRRDHLQPPEGKAEADLGSRRGYGATPRDATGFLTPERAAADVAAALRTIGDRPALFGWSMGSFVAQLASQRTPELMSAAILFGASDPDDKVPEHPEPETPAREPTTAERAGEDFRARGVISRRAIDAYVRAAVAADPVRADLRHPTEWNVLAPEAVHVPVLLFQAELDPGAHSDGFAKMFARLGAADRQWVVIPGGDHARSSSTRRAHDRRDPRLPRAG